MLLCPRRCQVEPSAISEGSLGLERCEVPSAPQELSASLVPVLQRIDPRRAVSLGQFNSLRNQQRFVGELGADFTKCVELCIARRCGDMIRRADGCLRSMSSITLATYTPLPSRGGSPGR